MGTFIDQINENESDIADLETDMDTAQSDIDTAEADIVALETEGLGRLFKQVLVASTANIADLSTGLAVDATLDGVTLAAGDRVLVKDQSSAWLNGIYVVAATGAPTRATDADSEAEMLSALILVQKGTSGVGTILQCTAYDDTETTGAVTLAARSWGE